MNTIKTIPRRKFSDRAREQMTNVQLLRERLKGLRPIVPIERQDELQAWLDILEGHIDFVLDGNDPSYNQTLIEQIRLCGRFRDSI